MVRASYRHVTSLRQGPRDGSAFDGARKAHDLAPGETLLLGDLTGAGRIVRLWMTLPLLGQRRALTDLVLRAYWDGEAQPSIEVPLGEFFGAAFGKPREVIANAIVHAGGAWLSRLEMPFNTAARLELRNEGSRRLRQIFFQVGYLEEPERDAPQPTLHAQHRRRRVARHDPPLTLLEARGSGRLVGLTLALENRSWWLRPPFQQMALPRGFGLGLLEGWETVTVDGHPLVGTGAEDYFSSGFYFAGGPFCTPTHGCTHRSFLTGRVAAYRFHEGDAIPFTRSLTFALDHGLHNAMAGDYASTAYWYQQEPHAPFPPLPTTTARRYRWPWLNPVQWLLLASAALLVVLALLSVTA